MFIKYSLGVIESELSKFLRTRTHVFPRLNLSLLSRSPFGLAKALSTSMITSMFPQVRKLLYHHAGGAVEAVGFISQSNRERRFAGGPVRLTDVPVDHFLAAVHLRLTMKHVYAVYYALPPNTGLHHCVCSMLLLG